jgi:hypothetical protein
MRKHRGRCDFGKAKAAIPRRGCRLRGRSGKSIAAIGGKIPFLAATSGSESVLKGCLYK